MTIKVFRDSDSLSVFFQEGIVGAWPFNSLQAIGNGDDSVSIRNLAKEYTDGTDFFEIVDVPFGDFEDNTGTAYGSSEAEAVNSLNAAFSASGSPNVPPDITSPLSISLTTGETLNYELVAAGGVGYEWENLPSGITTVEGNVRKLLGGSGLSAGTYTFTATAINYFGTDTETITLTVSDPPFNDTKSVNFVQQDYLGANADMLQNVLGRGGNGSGPDDAWTISFWFKGGTNNNNNQTIFYFGGNDLSNSGRIQLTYRGGDGSMRLFYGSSSNNLKLDTPNLSLPQGSWHHVLVTYNGGTTGTSSGDLDDYYSRFSIWIDGANQTTTNTNDNYGYSSVIPAENLRVGRLNGNYMRDNCRVDELAVWSSDQSSKVSDIYNSGAPGDLDLLSTPPGHWWRMGDGDTYPVLQDAGGAHFVMYNMTVADIVTDTP